MLLPVWKKGNEAIGSSGDAPAIRRINEDGAVEFIGGQSIFDSIKPAGIILFVKKIKSLLSKNPEQIIFFKYAADTPERQLAADFFLFDDKIFAINAIKPFRGREIND